MRTRMTMLCAVALGATGAGAQDDDHTGQHGPPPAPLPSETSIDDAIVPRWLENGQRRKRIEDIVGTIGLTLMVGAMLVAMWLRMVGP